MGWLKHLLGHGRPMPVHIQEALDTAAEASKATDEAHTAVMDYWVARRATDDLLGEYIAAEARRATRGTRRRGH